MGSGVSIEVPRVWHRWSLGARAMRGGFVRQQHLWADINEEFFRLTQEFVHVETGRLKASGERSVHNEGPRVYATVSYGDDDEVNYAQYEINRSGDHDFMGRGWEASQRGFQEAFGKTWLRMIESWSH